jgi:hypothetical protein
MLALFLAAGIVCDDKPGKHVRLFARAHVFHAGQKDAVAILGHPHGRIESGNMVFWGAHHPGRAVVKGEEEDSCSKEGRERKEKTFSKSHPKPWIPCSWVGYYIQARYSVSFI